MNKDFLFHYDFAECDILNKCKCAECGQTIFPGQFAITNIDVEEEDEMIFHLECFKKIGGEYIEG